MKALGDAFEVMSCLFGVLFCSEVLAADAHLKQLNGVVSSARFLTWGVFEYDITHRRSVAVLCILYKIRCNPMHPLYSGRPLPSVPVWVTRSAFVGHLYTYAPLRYEPGSTSGILLPT